MNLKHLFFLAVAGTLAVACSEVNESSFTDGDGQKGLVPSVRVMTVFLHG